MLNAKVTIKEIGPDASIKVRIACPGCDHHMKQTVISHDDEPSILILTCFNSECDLEEKVFTIQTFTFQLKDTEHYIRHGG